MFLQILRCRIALLLLLIPGFLRWTKADQGPIIPLEPTLTKTHASASSFPNHRSQRVTITYAPVSIPPATEGNGIVSYEFMTSSTPCNDCFITFLRFQLHHSDGRPTGRHTGVDLHHIVQWNRHRTNGRNCGNRGEVIAAAGNDRPPIDLCADGTVKTGYYLSPTDEISLVVVLRNLRDVWLHEDVVVSITYDYVPRDAAWGFIGLTPYWLDIRGCDQLSASVPSYWDSVYNYSSPIVTGIPSGQIILAGGHLHDGATHMDLEKGGKVICRYSAVYSQEESVSRAGQKRGSQQRAGQTSEHISAVEYCRLPGRIGPQDELTIRAHYDTTLHDPVVLFDGSLPPAMGISLVYVNNDLDSTRTRIVKLTWIKGIGLLFIGLGVSILSFLTIRRALQAMELAPPLLQKQYQPLMQEE